MNKKEEAIGFNQNKPVGKRFDLIEEDEKGQERAERITQFFLYNIQTEQLRPISESDFDNATKNGSQPDKNIFPVKIENGKITDLIQPKNANLDTARMTELKEMIEQRITN